MPTRGEAVKNAYKEKVQALIGMKPIQMLD
jgi:hypothetical protein